MFTLSLSSACPGGAIVSASATRQLRSCGQQRPAASRSREGKGAVCVLNSASRRVTQQPCFHLGGSASRVKPFSSTGGLWIACAISRVVPDDDDDNNKLNERQSEPGARNPSLHKRGF